MNYQYPAGWVPPYHGAAPPMPAHVAVNAQQWQMGSWQFNPAYNHLRYPTHQSQWMAAAAWAHYPQHRQNYNPYKKVIKPPSAEYLAMEVNPNGLDLHNMVEVEDRYGDEENPDIPKTPWIWNPATLQNDAPSVSAQRAAIAAAANARAQIRHSSEPIASDTTSNTAQRVRNATDPSPLPGASSSNEPYNNSSPLKPTFQPTVVRTPDHYSNSSSSADIRLERTRTSESSVLGRHSSMPSIYSNYDHSTSTSSGQLSEEPASMYVLSPLDVSTPRPIPKRSITRGATHPEIPRQSSLVTITETSHTERSRLRDSNPPPQTAPVSSFRRPTNSEAQSRAEDPFIEAPSTSGTSQTTPYSESPSRRPTKSRSDSYPASKSKSRGPIYEITFGSTLPTTAEQASQQPQQLTPPEPHSQRQTSPPSSSTPRRPTQIYTPRRSSQITTPKQESQQTQQDRHTTPPRNGFSIVMTTTPKHEPQQSRQDSYDHHRTGTAPYVNTTNTAQHHDEPRPAPVKPVRTYHPVVAPVAIKDSTRAGFWNRRGDHCTKDGYIVFAPPDQAYPEDLARYPENEYLDEYGFRIAFDPTRPELPESLPRHGKPPQRPYSEFLVYCNP